MGKILTTLVLALFTAALPAADSATLSGVVTDEAGNPIKWATITVEGTDLHVTSLEGGEFLLADIPPGRYDIKCSAPGYVDCTLEDLLIIAGIRSTVHITLRRPPADQVLTIEKPNIYLYPPEATEVTVRLELGEGCALTYSDPSYGEGWTVNVEPDGWMDNGIGYVVGEVDGKEVIFDAPRYGCLFYEADAPDVWQRERGWLVGGADLRDFFIKNLHAYGFADREIKDFLDYWEPRLTDDYYAVFPQLNADIEPLIGLDVYPEPDSVLRLFYLIEPLDEVSATADWYLPEPVIPPFEREGFTVVEWGVCLDDGLR